MSEVLYMVVQSEHDTAAQYSPPAPSVHKGSHFATLRMRIRVVFVDACGADVADHAVLCLITDLPDMLHVV